MNNSIKWAATALGIYAGLLGMGHGLFEVLQVNIEPDGLLINAIGPPCDPEVVWHACLPAITFIPTMLVSGIAAILVGLSILIWVLGFIQKQFSGLILIGLSLLSLGVGGGFIPTYIGIVAGVTSTRIQAPLTWWRRRSPKTIQLLSRLWPWTVILLVVWFPGSWVLGYFFGQLMVDIGPILFIFFDIVLPILIVMTAVANDLQNQDSSG
jgi:hypothetical protein